MQDNIIFLFSSTNLNLALYLLSPTLKRFVYKSGDNNFLMSSRHAIMASATSYPQFTVVYWYLYFMAMLASQIFANCFFFKFFEN